MKFRQATNHCKRVLENAKLSSTTKTKESITSQKRGSRNFYQIPNKALKNGKSVTPPLYNGPAFLSSALDKAKLFVGNFFKNSDLDDASLLSKTNEELHS